MGPLVLAVDKLVLGSLALDHQALDHQALDHQALDHQVLAHQAPVSLAADNLGLGNLVRGNQALAHQALDRLHLLADLVLALTLALAKWVMDQDQINQIQVKTATDQALTPDNLVQHPHHPTAAAAQEEMPLPAEEALLAQDLIPVRVLVRSKDHRLHRVEVRDQVPQPPVLYSPSQHLPAKGTVQLPIPPLPSLPGLSVASSTHRRCKLQSNKVH